MEFDIHDIVDAKKNSEKRAGIVKTTDDGSALGENISTEARIPKTGIHEFENVNECICDCHNKDKSDCMYCYDHPVHLNMKRKKSIKQ